MEIRVDDGWSHRTQGGYQGSTTAASQAPGAPARPFPWLGAPGAADPAAGQREVLLRPAAHLGTHPVHGAQFPAAGVQPDPDGRELPLVHRLRAVRAVRGVLLPAVPDRGRDEPQLRPGRAQADRRGLGAPALPDRGRLPAGLRRADRDPAQRLVLRGRDAQPLSGPGHALRARRLGQPGTEGHGPPVRVRLRDPSRPRLVQEGRQPALRVPDLRRRVHPAAGRGFRPPPGRARRNPALPGRLSRGGNCPDAAVLSRPGSADVGRARSGRHSGALLPVHSDRPGQERRGDLRGKLRGLPAGGPGAQRRDVPRGALRGPVDRLRPAPAGVAAALPAGRRCPPATAPTTSSRS